MLRSRNPSGEPAPRSIASAAAALRSLDASWCCFGSPSFPRILSTIPDPPAVLFYRGDLEAFLGGPTVALIGSRRCSQYGLRVARALGRELASAGVGIVSGLARGIDSEAHRGCIDGGGRTLAVLGSGLDVIYPRENARLAEDISLTGILMSEFLPGTPPASCNFPRRNRLISAFSKIVVVVEAGDRSGTMITVDAALSQGRDVMAVPGEILRKGSTGSNRLLRDGAGVVTSASDVLDALGISGRAGSFPAAGPACSRAAPVIAALEEGPLHFDELLRRVSLEAPALLALLVDLEMEGRVVQRPGKMFEPG